MKTLLQVASKILIVFFIGIFPVAIFAQWAPAVNLSPGAVSAGLNESMGSCIGVNGNTVHVVWTDRKTSTQGVIYYTRSQDAGSTWSQPVAISNINGNAWNSAIAVNGPNIHVVWRNIVNNTRSSYYTHSTDGGNTWAQPVVLDSAVADWPAVSVSGNTVYVANDIVTSSSPYNTEIFLLRSTDNGATWSKHQQITFATGRSEDEAIYAQGSYVHMSWNDNRNGLMQIFYKQSTDFGVTWGPDVVVNSEASYTTMVNADGTNVGVVSAGLSTGKNYQLHLTQSTDNGNTWGAEKNLSNDSAHAYYYPFMVRNGNDLHITCVKAGVGGEYLHSADGGGTWSAPFIFFAGAIGITPFVAYTGCTVHIIYASAGHIYYLRNPTGNAGHCGSTAAISTGSVQSALCAGAAVGVSYTANGTYNVGNVFTAQLSDANGNFGSPVAIGSLSSIVSGTITAAIPLNTSMGTAYRIRVVSSNPVVTGSDNGANIFINSSPTATITASGSTTICSGSSVTLNANTGAGLTYQWLLNNGNISGATSSSYAASATGNYTCKISNGCGSATSNTISVNVNSVPVATIVASGVTTFCTGGSVSLSLSSAPGSSYQWKLNGANISGATASSYAATVTGSYSCLVTYSCGSSLSNTVTVTVNPPPSITLSANRSVICPGNPVILKVTAGYTYQWALNNVNIPGATTNSDTAVVAGTYMCVASNSCGSVSTKPVTLTANTAPAEPGAISVTNGTTGICPGDVRTFSVPAEAGALFYWVAPSGATVTSGQGTVAATISFSSSFVAPATLSVYATNSCGSSTSQTIGLTGCPLKSELLAQNDEKQDDKLVIYPNPTTQEVHIGLKNEQETITGVIICNTLGEVVLHESFSDKKGMAQSIAVDGLAPGIYFISVQTSLQSVTQKIIKQ